MSDKIRYLSGITEERAREIALKIVKFKMSRNGLNIDFMRNIGNAARDIGIETSEARAFVHYLLPEMLGDILDLQSVDIEFGPPKMHGGR